MNFLTLLVETVNVAAYLKCMYRHLSKKQKVHFCWLVEDMKLEILVIRYIISFKRSERGRLIRVFNRSLLSFDTA